MYKETHTQIHPHTHSRTHISVGTLPRFHPSPTLLRAARALGGFWFCDWWLWCQPGVQQAVQTPLHRLIICHHCLFLFFSLLMWIFVFKRSSDQCSVLLRSFSPQTHNRCVLLGEHQRPSNPQGSYFTPPNIKHLYLKKQSC